MANKYWIVARDKPGLLIAMMKAYAGDAHISLEGDLSKSSLSHIEGVSGEETEALRRNTEYPKQDFVVIALSEATIKLILAAILPENRYMTDIEHIQIESQGSLVFGTYDNFHPECIVFYDEARGAMIERLHRNGVLRSYEVVPIEAPRWHG